VRPVALVRTRDVLVHEWLLTVAIGRIGVVAFGIVGIRYGDQERVEALRLARLHVAHGFFKRQIVRERPRCVSVDEERHASLIDQVATIFCHHERELRLDIVCAYGSRKHVQPTARQQRERAGYDRSPDHVSLSATRAGIELNLTSARAARLQHHRLTVSRIQAPYRVDSSKSRILALDLGIKP
jgi:hypothetical protein